MKSHKRPPGAQHAMYCNAQHMHRCVGVHAGTNLGTAICSIHISLPIHGARALQ